MGIFRRLMGTTQIDAKWMLHRAQIMLHEESEKRQAFFEIIESMEKERNQWRDMYYEQSRAHLRGQVVLEGSIERLGELVSGLVKVVNLYRKDKGEEPIDTAARLKDLITNTSVEYQKQLDALEAAAPEDGHGVQVRDDLVDSWESEPKTETSH
jgi:hypothetical protein